MNLLSPSDPDIRPDKLKPFKVCFVTRKELGRSNITIGKPLRLAPIVTSKFYVQNHFICEDIQAKIKELIVTGPKEEHKYPQTQNQKYGWYEFDCLNESKLDFRKTASQFIKEHLMIYENIRD